MLAKALPGAARSKGGLPLVDMQVGRHVGSETRRRGGARNRLQGEVVRVRLFHAHIPEVEAVGPERLQVPSQMPGRGNRRRVHGGERRRHLHNEFTALFPLPNVFLSQLDQLVPLVFRDMVPTECGVNEGAAVLGGGCDCGWRLEDGGNADAKHAVVED